MTSKSSSLANPLTIQKQLCTRRLWIIALLSVYSFLSGPILSIIVLAASKASLARNPVAKDGSALTQALYYSRLQTGVRTVHGIVSPMFVGTLFWAVLMGLAVFAYLSDSRKLDFYEAQPMKRSRRFLQMYGVADS